MATLAAASNHNFTASSWGTVDATALLASNAANTTLTTAYVLSQTFTPGAITVDGIAVWVNTRLGSTGTISVALDAATVTVPGTEVSINVSDIPSDGNCWVFFKFAAPVLLVAATAYTVKAKTSNATQVNLFRNANAGNWSRLLRTTTLAAPGSGDNLYVIGEKTGAGTGNTITVTMDNTATTTWGLVDVSSGGFLINGAAGATAYRLKLGGNLNIRSGGEVNIGTTSARIPSGSTAEWDFANAVNVDFGIIITGNGILRTGGNNNANPWALLAADAAGGATSLTTDRSTGWKNGDTIAIASTTRTASECESKALGADASGTSLPTIAALANAHAGGGVTNGSDVVAELANLTRNVKIHGASATLQAFISCTANTTVSLNDTELSFMGSNTTGKRGINIGTTTGSFVMSYCSIHDFTVANSIGLLADAAGVTNTLIEHTVIYLCALNCINIAISTVASGVVLNDVVAIRTTGGTNEYGALIAFNNSVTNLRCAGAADSGIVIGESSATGGISGLVSHSHAGYCLELQSGGSGNGSGGTLSDILLWRGTSGQITFVSNTPVIGFTNLTFDGLTAFGTQSNVYANTYLSEVVFIDATLRAGLNLTADTGIEFDSRIFYDIKFVNSVFGGSGQTHSAGDVVVGIANCFVQLLLDNCILNSATQILGPGNLTYGEPPQAAIRANFLGQTQNHKTWLGTGTWSYDTVIADASPSLRMTPLSASLKLVSPSFKCGVLSGQAVTVSVKVRKSVIGDGAAYNGAQVRLFVRRNYGAGITSDTLLDTSTAAADGAFENLSGVTGTVSGNCVLEFYLDCDGTAGWVNIDTLTMTAT